MARPITRLTQEATNLNLTITSNSDEMIRKGFPAPKLKSLSELIAAVVRTNSGQIAARNNVSQNTAMQNTAIAAGISMVTKIQNAGRSAFGKNKTKQKEFKIGSKKSRSVGKLAEILDYLAGVCTKYHDVMLENGMTDADIASISTVYANLVAADALQEHSKKLGNVATKTRNDAVAALEDEMFRIRNFAKSAFAGNKELLEQFKPISRTGRRSGGTNQSPPAAQG